MKFIIFLLLLILGIIIQDKYAQKHPGSETEAEAEEEIKESSPHPPKILYIKPWTEEKVRNIKKGDRPDPTVYLQEKYIHHHRKQFKYGAGKIIQASYFEERDGKKYTELGPPNGLFVMPSYQLDQLLIAVNGSIDNLEKALGITPGYWKGKALQRVDILDPEPYQLRMPSGNERGANELWIPGGLLPSGYYEAVINGVPKDHLIIRDINVK